MADLAVFPREETWFTLLQYVNDLLLAGETEEECVTGTRILLELLPGGTKSHGRKLSFAELRSDTWNSSSVKENEP